MPDHRPEIRLGEYQTTDLGTDQLTAGDVARLHALQGRGCLSLTTSRTGWRLKAGATVGVLVLDRIRLVVEPRFAIPGDQLMTWLAYALHTHVPMTARRWSTGPDGYADLVAAALLEECEKLLREGLRRDYVRRQSLEPVLRGRLDVAAQATRRFGQLDQLHVRTFDREADIWDNLVLGIALQAAFSLTSDSRLASALHGITDAFPHASTPATALRALQRTQYTRLNARYRPAHTWARLLLRGGGVTDLQTDDGTTAGGLLLAMPALWEAVVRRLATEAAVPRGGRPVPSNGGTGITVRGDLGSTSTFRPDLLLRLPATGTDQYTLLPIDAKYKRYDRRGVSAGDIHQLLTYSAGYTPAEAPRAVIVHPQPGEYARRTLRIGSPQRGLGVIHVLGIDTHAPPEQASAWMRAALP
ncbi:McrC family protein [Streptomyces glomeratus]|uniref:McrBC 5-methylcytosine restriction system component n=1 Tax=Streptomyces glomeratus TaxID=284452 RepID=A0ABP6LN04_9ACTN|nr:McrC family protein [Streptomyces glomeratus]MCF1510502.1 McrC family protein [Streptomyces glomeratus]